LTRIFYLFKPGTPYRSFLAPPLCICKANLPLTTLNMLLLTWKASDAKPDKYEEMKLLVKTYKISHYWIACAVVKGKIIEPIMPFSLLWSFCNLNFVHLQHILVYTGYWVKPKLNTNPVKTPKTKQTSYYWRKFLNNQLGLLDCSLIREIINEIE
jgi:hypothetical protein